ncbi:pyridoxal phosphate-dependent transferase [Mycena rosella]|uniref:Pyridoxal phosphate-dependent transferase n=1 Tax=Mycena rosella TaxID=1033263 RepID=A0AAD7AWZ6_MYCRO|nr:pyridoxal phosphate-dependent transferase [Mycena rosella]
MSLNPNATAAADLLAYAPNVTHGLGRITEGIMARGSGSYVTYADGRKMLDFTCGIGVTSLGHCHPKVSAAAAEQCMQLVHGQCSIAFTRQAAAMMPHPSLDSFFFWNSGSEAVEAALKLARIATGRQNIICMQGAYHGRTFGAMAVTRSKTIYSAGVAPLMPGVFTTPFPFWHQLGLEPSASTPALVEQYTAAIIVEPVLGEGGYVPAPPAFLAGLRAVCDKHGMLLIADEVQSGFARTGRFFAIEESGVRPDVMVIAKGLANGFPLSGVVSRKELTDKLPPGSMGGTYAGNAVSCAAACAAVKAAHPSHVIDVRGRGLMVAVEFTGAGVAARVAKKCVERGMLILTTSVYEVVRFIPPLNIAAADLAKGAEYSRRRWRRL